MMPVADGILWRLHAGDRGWRETMVLDDACDLTLVKLIQAAHLIRVVLARRR